MDLRTGLVLAACAVGATAAHAFWDGRYSPEEDRRVIGRLDDVSRTRQAIADWPRYAQDLAGAAMQEYGAPDEIMISELRWRDKRPWKRVVVFRDALSADHPDGLLQSVAYTVPRARLASLGAFGHGVTYDPFLQEMVVRSSDEAANRLALNLAEEVIRERRTVPDAIAFYDQTLSLSLSGKMSPYLTGLLFSPEVQPLPAPEAVK